MVRVVANTGAGGPNGDHVVVAAVDACPNDSLKTEPGACGCGVPEGSCGGTSVCTSANEFGSVALSCAGGGTIDRITFASYGAPTGSCPAGFSTGTCHASSSLQRVETACLGKQSCTVDANNGVFEDPCDGVPKSLAVTYTCSGTPVPQTCPASPSLPAVTGCDGVLLTDPSSVEARSSGITNTSGPSGAHALRIGDDQSIDVKDSGCLQLGKSGADFSISMWLKATAGTSQIFGTTSQYSMRPGFVLYTESSSDENLELHAVYGGHREMDLAMLQLFGSPSPRFFAAYDEVYSRAKGSEERLPLMQLYPLLVHVCLFGSSYTPQLLRALRSYC